MTDQELIARAEDLIAAWNERDVDRIVSAFCADAELRSGRARPATGREAVRIDAEGLFDAFPDLRLEVRRTISAGHVVTQEWIARSAAGRLAVAGVTVADYDTAGRIASYARYWER